MCKPDQIIILSGSTEGFFILGELFKNSNNEIIIEDPSYNGISRIFTKMDFNIIPVPADEMGINTDLIPDNIKPSLIVVTPSHQFPLGGVLPIQRRIKLIESARKIKAYIVENDYDSEFRFTGPPISALHLLDSDKVIHIGTFSESMFPSLRIGYIILPESLIESANAIKSSYGLFTSTIKQIALSNFITKGYLERHIAKMKKKFQKKHEIIKQHLKTEFNNSVIITGDPTGLFVVAEFKNIKFTKDIIDELYKNKVIVHPIKEHSILNKIHVN